MATLDPYIVIQSYEYREELNTEWEQMEKVLSAYPELFPNVNKKSFLSFYAQVCTRCFGYGLPYCAMIPMADNLNHSDVNVSCEVINKTLHLEADESSTYFTKTKFMNDYSRGPIFNNEELHTAKDFYNV